MSLAELGLAEPDKQKLARALAARLGVPVPGLGAVTTLEDLVHAVDRHALAPGHVANNVLAMKGVAATGPGNHQVVNTANHDRIIAQTDELLDSTHTATQA